MDDPVLDAIDSKWCQSFRRRLLSWYRKNARDLPWRRTHDPYAIWVSEIMLQQTQVETVKPYYARFLKAFPNVKRLAKADEREVLRLWEGLGYYRRARQLHAAAQQIVERFGGRFPESFDDVLALPGIGRYTAGAILSFATDQRLPIVEANTLRLYSRLLALREDPRKRAGQDTLWKFAEQILPKNKCGEMNQALIELGSQICSPTSPACEECPVASGCAARREGCVDEVPVKAKRMAYESVTEAAVVVRHRKRILIRRCQPGERWAGLWDFPRCRVASNAPAKGATSAAQRREIVANVAEQTGFAIELKEQMTSIQHAVTRFRITLLCFEGAVPETTPARSTKDLKWVSLGKLDEYPLSVTGRKISQLL